MTTPYIEAKKAEVRKKFQDFMPRHWEACGGWDGSQHMAIGICTCPSGPVRVDMKNRLDETIDTLLDEIQEAVVPEGRGGKEPGSLDQVMAAGFNACRAETVKKFQHLRTGVTE